LYIMGLSSKDRSKILVSFARWIAGLAPRFGSKHYFEKFSFSVCIKEKYGDFRGLKKCPFCGKTFIRASALVSHIMRFHGPELEKLLDECEEP